MAAWYQRMITNARLNPKAQEYHNTAPDLIKSGDDLRQILRPFCPI